MSSWSGTLPADGAGQASANPTDDVGSRQPAPPGRWQRHQLADGLTVHRDNDLLAILHPAQYAVSVIPEIPCRDDSHAVTAALM